MPETSLPIYEKWEDIPDDLKTKTSLAKMGLRVAADQKPAAQIKRSYKKRGRWLENTYALYQVKEAVPKRKMSAAQTSALEKAQAGAQASWLCASCGMRLSYQERQHRNICDRCRDRQWAVDWAKHLLDSGRFVIMDTETTGLDGEIIEVAIIDSNGRTLINTRLNPITEIEPGAAVVHGLTAEMLEAEPRFPDVYTDLKTILSSSKAVVIFNAEFDNGRLRDTCQIHGLPPIPYTSSCAMRQYARYCGEWSNYFKSYKWQALPGGDHSALGDCVATLDLIHQMARSLQ